MAAPKIPVSDNDLLQANVISLAKEVAKHYSIYIKNVKNKKSAHGLRVAVKKLRCVYELDEMMELKIFNNKVFKNYRIMFKSVGALREWNLLKERYAAFTKHKTSVPFIVYIHKKENKAALEIKREVMKTSALQRYVLLNKTTVKHLTYKLFHDYYLQRMQQSIQLLVDAAIRNKKWHRLRKQLKRCSYLAEIIGKEPHKAFVELQDLLGKWHDAHIQLELVERYLNKHGDQFVRDFQKELTKRRKKFTKQIEECLTKIT